MDKILYCVRFKKEHCGTGYLRPYNAVRDGETYSNTYLTPSNISGIEQELQCEGKILRHKLRFTGMTDDFFRSPEIMAGTTRRRPAGISTLHILTDPEIILGFEKKEDAEYAAKNTLYVGQTQYIIYPVPFDDDMNGDILCGKDIPLVVRMTEEQFSLLSGTETFQVSEEEGVYCGNNRYKNNERMYIKIIRTK